MKYKIEVWPIMKLVELYNDGKIDLNPKYQRNSIWNPKAQKLLIDTIKNDLPLPTFFIQQKEKDFEMVDGQQRTRALLAYVAPDGFEDDQGIKYNSGEFDNYQIAVVILSKDLLIDEIREFYVRVNRSGLKLERPELNKAEYFKTRFLKLSTELSEMVEFRELKVFKAAQIRRMFDRDFIEEIAALITKGPTDKKTTVDQMYKSDISEDEAKKIKETFTKILNRIGQLNQENPLSESRFTQKNDFYTLVSLLKELDSTNDGDLIRIYKVLLFISKDISPSKDECLPLKEYGENCVTQSNSKKARTKRLDILKDLLMNTTSTINSSQKAVADYYGLSNTLEHIGAYYTFSLEK
jgi:Protein of unknown function DUF262